MWMAPAAGVRFAGPGAGLTAAPDVKGHRNRGGFGSDDGLAGDLGDRSERPRRYHRLAGTGWHRAARVPVRREVVELPARLRHRRGRAIEGHFNQAVAVSTRELQVGAVVFEGLQDAGI